MAEYTFNPNEHLMQLKHGQIVSDYLPVAWRLVWFRTQCPQGTIDTEELAYDLDRACEAEVYAWNAEKRRSEKVIKKARGYARYRAIVTDGKGGRATATKSENAASFSEFGEKAETGAVGRALAMLGYGTQFAPELSEEDRIVDAPVDRKEATNGTTHQDKPHVAPAYREVYLAGGKKRMWSSSTEFYAAASAILGRAVVADNVRQLSERAIAELAQAIELEPVKA